MSSAKWRPFDSASMCQTLAFCLPFLNQAADISAYESPAISLHIHSVVAPCDVARPFVRRPSVFKAEGKMSLD